MNATKAFTMTKSKSAGKTGLKQVLLKAKVKLITNYLRNAGKMSVLNQRGAMRNQFPFGHFWEQVEKMTGANKLQNSVTKELQSFIVLNAKSRT